jgi:Fic family protein
MIEDYDKKIDYGRFRMEMYPVTHKRKVPFDPRIRLNLEYRKMLSEIRALDRKLGGMILSGDDYLELVMDAYADNIHWSVKLEGNELSLEEVKKLTTLFSKGKAKENNPGPVQEILNHLYSFIAEDHFNLPWEMEHMIKAHDILMDGVIPDESVGVMRTFPVSVVGTDGKDYFKACPPEHVEEEMTSLLEWLKESPYDEIITSVLFFHEFESIHPFGDGNGRTGRTLFQILLQELGLRSAGLCKFEQKLLQNRENYYSLLAYADRTSEYYPLIMYVAEALLSAYREAAEIFEVKDVLKGLDENSKVFAVKAKKQRSFTLADAKSWIEPLGEQTVRSKLNELVDLGVLRKQGKTKGMKFEFNDLIRVRIEESEDDPIRRA